MFIELNVANTGYKAAGELTWHKEWVNINAIERAFIAGGLFRVQISGQSFPVHPDDIRPLLKEMGFERVPLKGLVEGL